MSVSFCITCYDRDVHLVQQALSYVKNQTAQPDEILVIASGIKSLGYHDPDITVYTFENRMGPGQARNKGGELATGNIVCFCDVDDPIHPQKCEVVKRVFDNKKVDALIHNYKMDVMEFEPLTNLDDIQIEQIVTVDSRWEKEQHHVFNPHKDIPHTNVEAPSKQPVCHGHMSARKELLADISYREDMWLGEDGDFCQSIVKSAKYSLYYTPLILMNYITK